MVRATPELVATAVVGVVVCRVNSGRWCSKTAATEMTKLRSFVENQFPGTSDTPMWKKLRTELENMPHVPNQAPPLSWMEISLVLGCLDSDVTRAVFWLALLTCSRVGNLGGLEIMEVHQKHLLVSNREHKTYAKVGCRTLSLWYWNEKMTRSIWHHLPTGRIPDETLEEVELCLKRLGVRCHSVRRTGVQVYRGARVSDKNVRAITLHSSDEMLHAYDNVFEPIYDSRESTGIAKSLAPFIVDIVQANRYENT